MSVAAAEAALARGDVDGAARALLAAWRELPHADLADALDRFPVRPCEPLPGAPTERMNLWLARWGRAGPLDVVPLLEALVKMLGDTLPRFTRPCFDALAAAAPDPRVGRLLVSLAPMRERPLAAAFHAALWRHASARDLERLKDLVESTQNGKLKMIRHTVAKKASGLALDRDTRARVLVLGASAAKAPLPAVPQQSAELLLQRVREAPDDATCREVLRDWLLEQGDPWGELIALQEHRARTAGEQTPRERALLRKVKPRILGTLAGAKKAMLDGLEFERGFLVAATIDLNGVTRVAALLARPELSTLERVSFVRASTLTPNLLALREAHGVRGDSLAAIVKRTPHLKLEALSVVGGPAYLVDVAGWPTLRELFLEATLRASTTLRRLPALHIAKELRVFGIRDAYAREAFDGWSWQALDQVPPPVRRFVIETVYGLDAVFTFDRLDDGWSVTVSPPTRPLRARLPLDTAAVRAAATVLRESKSVTLAPELPAELRAALGG